MLLDYAIYIYNIIMINNIQNDQVEKIFKINNPVSGSKKSERLIK